MTIDKGSELYRSMMEKERGMDKAQDAPGKSLLERADFVMSQIHSGSNAWVMAQDWRKDYAAQQAPCYSEGNQQATAHKARATPARLAGEDHVDTDYRVPAQPAVAAPSCEWSPEDIDCDTWQTTCGNLFTLNDGTPKENSFSFCCYCGKPLEESPFSMEDENDDK